MRNNPKHGSKSEYTELFQKYIKAEKIRRFFMTKRPKIYKSFMLQIYHSSFAKKNAKHFIEQVDSMFKMAGKLVHFFIIEDNFPSLKEEEKISFEAFFDKLVRWALTQEKMTYDDFALYEDQMSHQDEIDAFKKMTERIL